MGLGVQPAAPKEDQASGWGHAKEADQRCWLYEIVSR